MLEVEEALFGNPEDDYNDVLQVLVQLDTNAGKSKKADLDYCIEMAAKPIQWHKSSKWVDDCWLLIGKARLYQGDFTNASRSFKYVNSNSDDPDARHEALVLLMRSFTDMEEFQNANYVDDFIRKDTIPFSDKNARDYHLTRAHFHRIQGNYEQVVQHLEVALQVIGQKKRRGRISFILAQLYNRAGNEEKAYAYYQEVLNNRPSFELETYAKVNAYGLQPFETEEEKEKARQYYARLLKDDKYWDYRDKIRYEQAGFELRQGEEEEALTLLNEAITISKNPAQMAYAYLQIGKLAFEEKDFEKAALYYDSAVRQMPQKFDVYETLQEQQQVLSKFAAEQKAFKKQDRLKMLSKMDSASLSVFLLAEYEKDKEAALQQKQFEEMRSQLRKQEAPTSTSTPFQQAGEAAWYFYNPQSAANGKVAFIRAWGNRPLEDDWRRSKKPFNFAETEDLDGANESMANADTVEAVKEVDMLASIPTVEDRMMEIPRDPMDLQKIDMSLQESLFKLGKIYFYDLEDAEGTLTSLGRLVREYPQYDSIPEALYLLNNLCGNYEKCSADTYKAQLIEQYPESLYAKILKNPDYLEEAYKDDIEAEKIYKVAYKAYQEDDLTTASNLLGTIRARHGKTSYMDKVALLEAMILGKQEQYTAYYEALQSFMAVYEKSQLRGYAQQLSNAIPKDKIRKP